MKREDGERLTKVRFADSILGPQPLVYLDGVRLESAEDVLRNLNPDDIERIEVIKGNAAKELWGAKAANGVITIFTKHSTQDVRRTRSN